LRNEYKILVGKPEEEGLLECQKHKWEDNIEMFLKQFVRIWSGLKCLEVPGQGCCGHDN
jgi:hypothetical protein